MKKADAPASNDPRMPQGKASQDMANGSPRARKLEPLQEMADGTARNQELHRPRQTFNVRGARQERSLQKKNNDTGLPDHLKSGIEGLSGYSVDDVRVHYNSSKPSQLNAHAYAQGPEIYLGPGQEKHLPHEAWHVVQQKQGRVKTTMQMKDGVNLNDDMGLEREADEMGAKAVGRRIQEREVQMKRDSPTQQPIQRVNKLGFEIEFRKNPIFKRVGLLSYGRANGFISGTVKAAATEQRPRIEMQPDAARAAGIGEALDAIPEAWRRVPDWAALRARAGSAFAPEVKTKVEYAHDEGQLLNEDLDWIQTNWFGRYGATRNVAETRDYTGEMYVGVPTAEVAQWAIRPATAEQGDAEERAQVVQTLSDNLVGKWGAQNDPALHLQVTSGVDLARVGDTFTTHAAALTEKSQAIGGPDQEEALRAAKILNGAVGLAETIMNVYSDYDIDLPNAAAVHGAWALMFQDLLRLIVGVKRVGSSVKNTFVLMPRSTKVTLDTIGQSITKPDLYKAIMAKAEILLVGALYKELNISPDEQTLSFLNKIQEQIAGQPLAAPQGGEERWAYRFTTLFAAMDSFAATVDKNKEALPWSVTGGREIRSPKENAILLEDRHINKFVTDWASLVDLIHESLGQVQD